MIVAVYARRMMFVSTIGHPLDDVAAMLGYVHVDPTAHAHGPRPFRCGVDPSQRVLQRRITRCIPRTFDQELLLFHAVSRASPNIARAYTNSRTSAFSDFRDSCSL